MTINTYDDEKTYKHGEFCEHNGVTYRASCGGSSVVGIAPDDNSIGVFWDCRRRYYCFRSGSWT